MPVNSHVQIPNFILKNFRNSSGKVDYLDLNSEELRISSSGTNRLGTVFGYYSDEVERFLSSEIERPFSLAVNSIKSFLNSDNISIELPISVEDDFKKYIAASAVRSNLALDSFLQGSITAQFCSNQENHDSIVAFSLNRNNEITKAIDGYGFSVLVNETSQNYVVPRNCFYTVMSHGFQCIVAPISPTCAFALLPGNYSGSLTENGRIAYIDAPEDIKIMNTLALRFEYAFNKSFIAASSRADLQYLKEYVELNRESLEKSWIDVRN